MKDIFTYIFQDKKKSEYVKAKDPDTTNLKSELPTAKDRLVGGSEKRVTKHFMFI